jgi:tetratricopeptide (TPR) repeat protein
VCGRIADSHDPQRMLWLGELYASHGAHAEALGPLRTAAQLAPQSFDAWHNLGRSLCLLKRYGEAVPALQKAAALNPGYFDTLNLLAAALHASGDDAAALPVLERAHALNPADTVVAAALERMRAERSAAAPRH